MLGNQVKLKTDTKTLVQIEEILAADPQGQDSIQEAIIDAISKLHTKTLQGEALLLLVDETHFDVSLKKEHRQFMRDLTGRKGPYKVTKTYKSWVGLSEGVYTIEDCDKLIPVSWCKKKASISKLTALSIFLAISSVVQSGALIALLLL
jgi:hypothetical protein